jgi:hypothetical protein
MRPPAPAVYRKTLTERLRLSACGSGRHDGGARGGATPCAHRFLSRSAPPARSPWWCSAVSALDSVDRYGPIIRGDSARLAVSRSDPYRPGRCVSSPRRPACTGGGHSRHAGAGPSRAPFARLVLIGLPAGASMRRLVERGGREVALPSDGIPVPEARRGAIFAPATGRRWRSARARGRWLGLWWRASWTSRWAFTCTRATSWSPRSRVITGR